MLGGVTRGKGAERGVVVGEPLQTVFLGKGVACRQRGCLKAQHGPM